MFLFLSADKPIFPLRLVGWFVFLFVSWNLKLFIFPKDLRRDERVKAKPRCEAFPFPIK